MCGAYFMSRKQYSKELKLKLVKQHIEDGVSYWKLGKENGIEASIIRRWGQKYETFGEDGLKNKMLIYVITLLNLRKRLFMNILKVI